MNRFINSINSYGKRVLCSISQFFIDSHNTFDSGHILRIQSLFDLEYAQYNNDTTLKCPYSDASIIEKEPP